MPPVLRSQEENVLQGTLSTTGITATPLQVIWCMYQAGSIVPATFQRGNKWTIEQMRNLISSLRKSFPSGVIVFYREERNVKGRMMYVSSVIDGAHRLRSCIAFIKGDFAIRDGNTWVWFEKIPEFHKSGIKLSEQTRRGRKEHEEGDENNRVFSPEEYSTFLSLISFATITYTGCSTEDACKMFTQCQHSVTCSLEDHLRAQAVLNENRLILKCIKMEEEIEKAFRFCDPSVMRCSKSDESVDLHNLKVSKPTLMTNMVALFMSMTRTSHGDKGEYLPGSASRPRNDPKSVCDELAAEPRTKDPGYVDDFMNHVLSCCKELNELCVSRMTFKFFVIYMHCFNHFENFAQLLQSAIFTHGGRVWESECWGDKQGHDLSTQKIAIRMGKIEQYSGVSVWVPGGSCDIPEGTNSSNKRPRLGSD